jgi:hypothetical protein
MHAIFSDSFAIMRFWGIIACKNERSVIRGL